MIHFEKIAALRTAALAAIVLVLCACGKGQQPAAPGTASTDKAATPAAAVVDGSAISREEFDVYLRSRLPRGKSPGDVTAEEKNAVLDDLINAHIVAAAALKDGLDKDPEVATQLELTRTQLLGQAELQKYVKDHPPSDADLKAAYDAMPDKTQYHAAHILVADKAKAEQAIKKLKGGAKFEDLAKAESTDPSKDQGGVLPWLTGATMVKPFADALKSLKPGEFTQEPVQTQFGWHVIKLLETREAPFDDVKQQLTNAALQKNVRTHFEDMKKTAKIEKNL